MHSLIKHYWWLIIVLILRVYLCDCLHRLLVADEGGWHIDDSCPISPVLFFELDGVWNLIWDYEDALS